MSIESPKFNKPEEPKIPTESETTVVSPEDIETKVFSIPILDRELIKIGAESQEKKAEFLNWKKGLPEDVTIDLYHGLNGGLKSALDVLESPEHGIKQISGPSLSIYPVGQFWKPGDAGFHYSVTRKLIEFPGESNPDAKFRVDNGGSVFILGDNKTLPITEFNGEVMRTERKEDVYEERLVDGIVEDIVVGERTVELTDEEKWEEAKIIKKISELKSASALKR